MLSDNNESKGDYMEHLRPNGLAAGYFCMKCGAPTAMMVHKDCAPNPQLVNELIALNARQTSLKDETVVQLRPNK